ncbi:MAG TPA: hypothetical protein VJB02_02370 [Coxiellaceae bacterium]|nr:hypothetical protein [Coxiellaceae bacterium]
MKWANLIGVGTLSVALVACHPPENREYLSEDQEVQPLIIPAGVTMTRGENYYPIPPLKGPVSNSMPSLKPPTLQ